ncbi:MAG: hypothetical protein LBK65_07630 [Tannerellaceae bacterium]|jgi:hypothetical protein|nr:hypothetical protein [Tannerellaceae bacterium]
MHRAAILEKPDEDFLSFAKNINEQCRKHSEEWQIDRDRLDSLAVLVAAADVAFQASGNHATRNQITTVTKKTAFGELKRFLSGFINYLSGSTTVPDYALAEMHLRPRRQHSRQPLPPPVETPAINVIRVHDKLIVCAKRIGNGHPTHGVQVKHYFGFRLRWRFEDETHWRTEISTRLRYTLSFDDKDETRRIILTAAWVNPRLQEGLWSAEMSVVVG